MITRSLKIIPAEWMYFNPLSTWYIKNCMCSLVRAWGDKMIDLRSVSISSEYTYLWSCKWEVSFENLTSYRIVRTRVEDGWSWCLNTVWMNENKRVKLKGQLLRDTFSCFKSLLIFKSFMIRKVKNLFQNGESICFIANKVLSVSLAFATALRPPPTNIRIIVREKFHFVRSRMSRMSYLSSISNSTPITGVRMILFFVFLYLE